MSAQVIKKSSLIGDSASWQPTSHSVDVYNLAHDFMLALGKYLRKGGTLHSVLRVKVDQAGESTIQSFPDVLGSYQVLEDGIRFVPRFPFDRGILYQASFDPRQFASAELLNVLTLTFSIPRVHDAIATEVKSIFPSSDCLPENLLRFYVCFSNPMQRGRVNAEIAVLDPDGAKATEVLYRAPIELWDRSMRYLTILLDPGRLKRGVGPNRELGPPLKSGQNYTLVIGLGMVDLSGRQLAGSFQKRFGVSDAVRNHIEVDEWQMALPLPKSRKPLILSFQRPLDWALVSQMITIETKNGGSVEGRVIIDKNETRWSFVPTSPWTSGYYNVRIAPSLEDVCGNSLVAAFDRPLRSGKDFAIVKANSIIPFEVL